jgi:serine/threonine protein kinase
MSPEQVMGRQLTPTSDVFAIAVIVAELAAGRHPLREAETAFDMLQAVRDRTHVIATDTPLGATLHRIVFADQDGRPSAVELATKLEDLADRAGLDVTPAGLARRRVELGI